MNVEDFELECYLPEPSRYYFDSTIDEFHELTDLQKVQHLAFCVANGWNMNDWVEAIIGEEPEDKGRRKRVEEVLVRYIVFIRVHGDWNSECVDDTYEQMESYIKQFHSSTKDIVGILCSELNSYVHWTLDRGNITFDDKLEIRL